MKHATLLLFLFAFTAHATTLTVSSTADSGAGSLRAQIAAAATGDTIAITATGSITLTTGEIAVAGKNLTITGPGANALTITTNANTRALKITNAQCSISGITFDNCKGLVGDVDTGGAIAVDNFSSGGASNVITVSDCGFSNNQSGWGGALDVFSGGLVLNRCTFSGNSCTGAAFGTNGGGGALSIGVSLASTITNCTFSGNTQSGAATGQPGGGAIYNYGSGAGSPPEITVEHCTFVGNVDAAGAGGAIKGNYTTSYHTKANLRNCLLVGNQAPAATLRNFAGNATGSLATTYASFGGNVTDESATSAQFMAGTSDKTNSAALASSVSSSLALNGGPIKTHAITRGSPAQRRGQPSSVASDQRGAPRHSPADAGAFELIEPEISVTIASSTLANNAMIDFGQTPFDAPVTKTITIRNTQTSGFVSGPLSLAGLALSAGFTSSGLPAGSLANGESASIDVTLSAANTGLYAAVLTFTGNDAFSPSLATPDPGSPNLHTFRLAGLVTDTADHWRQQHFTPADIAAGRADDNANPSGDGLSNLLKYSLGLDPLTSCAPGSGFATAPDADGHLRMVVNKNPAATDLSLIVEVTGNLGNPGSWTTLGTTTEQNDATRLIVHDDTSMSSGLTRFIRLRVSRP